MEYNKMHQGNKLGSRKIIIVYQKIYFGVPEKYKLSTFHINNNYALE